MALQNRVDPQGEIISTSARGAWMGNRGQLHGTTKKIQRPFRLKAWITCLLEFKGWHREVMSPNKYTELFFFDEATAFSAGHRPCFECRRQAYDRFKTAWLKGNPRFGFNEKTSIIEIDKIIHSQRIDENRNKVTYGAFINELPNGTFILLNDQSYLVADGQIHLWTPSGYQPASDKVTGKVNVLTPHSIVNAFTVGYQPQILF